MKTEKKPDRRRVHRVPDGIRQRLAQARDVWTHEALSKADVAAVVVKNRWDAHGNSAHGLDGFIALVDDADRGTVRLVRPTQRREKPQRASLNHFESGAYHMLGMFGCQRKWAGKDAKECAELPGCPPLCAVCWYRQCTGLDPVTRQDLVEYTERER